MSQHEENAIAKAEQEAFSKKEQQRLENDRLKEEKRLAEERQKAYERNQERLRKESERRRKEQKDQKEKAKEEERLRLEKEEAKKQELEQQGEGEHQPINHNESHTQKAFERHLKEKAHSNVESFKAIEKHTQFKNKFEEWQKVNKSIGQTNDKAELAKLHHKKAGIEKDIEREYKVFREKPKLFSSKGKRAELDREYQGNLQDKLKELAKGKEHAQKTLADSRKHSDDKLDYKEYEKSIREQVQQKVQERANVSLSNSQERGR